MNNDFGIEVRYDFPNIQKLLAPTLPNFNLYGVDLISKKTFKELFNIAQSKNLPYYLFIAIPKRSNSTLTNHLINNENYEDNGDNNGKFLLLDASYFQQLKRQLIKCTAKNVHYLTLDCFNYSENSVSYNKFDSLTTCQHLYSSNRYDKNSEIKENIIHALVTPFIYYGNRSEETKKLFSNIHSQLQKYHLGIKNIISKLTTENLLEESGYSENYNELPPLCTNYIAKEKEKYSKLEKALSVEIRKWNDASKNYNSKIKIIKL